MDPTASVPVTADELVAFGQGKIAPDRISAVQAFLTNGIDPAGKKTSGDGNTYFLLGTTLMRQVGTGMPPGGLIQSIDEGVLRFWVLPDNLSVIDVHDDNNEPSLHLVS